MKRLRFTLFIFSLAFISFEAVSQYVFDSKKAEKLYYDLENYYAEPDYARILKNEENIIKNYLTKKDTLAALMYSFLAESYLMWEDDLEKSVDYYEKELAIRKDLQKPGEYQDLLFNLAPLYAELGKYDQAKELYVQLRKADEETYGKKSDEYIQTSLRFIDYYLLTEQLEEGLELTKEVDKLVSRNTFNDALVKKAYAEFYTYSGLFKKAEKNILDALKILEETGYFPSLEYVYFLNTMGIMYNDMGKLNIVEEIYEEALDMLGRLSGDFSEDEISIKSNLALLYIDLGNYTKAEGLLSEVMAFDKEYFGDDSYSYGFTRYNLGLNAFLAQNYSKAIEYLSSSSSIIEKAIGTDNLTYARATGLLSKTLTKTEEFEDAKKYNDISLSAYSRAVNEENPTLAFGYFSAGTLYENLNELKKAEEYHEKALNLRKKALGKYHPYYSLSSNQMAILKWNQQEVDEALTFYNETFDNYFTQINAYFPVLSEEEKSKFYYNRLKPAFEQFNSFIIENKTEDKKLIELMYNYQLSTKGLILYATNKVRESIVNSGDSVLIGKYETWIQQKELLAQLFSASDMDPKIRTRKIDSLTSASDKLESQLSSQSSAFAQNFAGRDLTWKDVQAKLKPDEAAVEIIRFRDFDPQNSGKFTDEVYYAALIVTTKTVDAPDLVIMRNGKMLESKYLSNYRNAIRYQINENYSYRFYWQPIANKLDETIKKVYFSPDGVFNQISIYTLQNPKTKKFTIDELEIQLVTNTKDLVAANFDKKTTFGDNPSYLFGYPNYNMGKVDQDASGNSETTEEGGENRGGNRGSRGSRGSSSEIEKLTRGGIPGGLRGNMLRYMRSNSLLALLPGTKKEVNIIDSLYHNMQVESKIFMAEEAVEDKIKSIKNPKTLHIATHGFFLELDPNDEFGPTDKYVENPLLRSGLILAGANSFIRYGEIGSDTILKEDGILTAYEAMNLNLDQTELVILSACETGLGEVKNGEGVYGLQRAFQIAGADALIMSMWTVDDNATQELMTLFYEEWLRSGDKHGAFIRAQKRLKDKWKKPFYWGAFVMVGG